MTMEGYTTPEWVRKARARAERWVLEDVQLSRSQWQALTYPELLNLPIVKRLHLNPSGGITRFPGSELQDVKFCFRVLKHVEHQGGIINLGEEFFGFGKTLEDAVRSTIQLVVELASMRGERS
jgi:phage pi2 protein 07